MGVRKNLLALMYAHELNQEGLARKIGVSQAAVSRWMAEDMGISNANLKKICELFGVSPNDILSDDGYAVKMGESGKPNGAVSPIASGAMVPVLGTAHMESFEDIEDTGFEAEVPSNVVKSHPRAFLIHGFGPCMNKRFPEDALLLIDPDMEPRNGDAVLVEDEDHRALVRVFTRGSSTLMLSPDSWSEDIRDIVGSPDDPPVRLVGVVVWYQAREDVRRNG